MQTENKHRVFRRWNIILFIFTAILMEIGTFIYNGIGFLPKYFLIDFAGILFFAFFLMFIPDGKLNIGFAMFVLFIQAVLSVTNANLLLITGEVFAWDMLSVLHEATRAVGKGIGFSFWYILIAVPILITYLLFAIKLYRYFTKGVEKPKCTKQSVTKEAILAVIVALVSSLCFTSQKLYIEDHSKHAESIIDDQFLYETFYSHQEGFKKFGTFGYYLISGIRQINNGIISRNKHQQDLKRDLDIYFNKNSNSNNHNELTGISKDNNLIYILWETGDFSGINKDLTPNLYKIFTEGLLLDQYYGKDQTNISEGKFLFGSYPNEGFLNYNYLNNAYPFTLPNMFKKSILKDSRYKGKSPQVVSYHNNVGTYYKRNISHEHFGFDEHVDAYDMQIQLNPDFWINMDSDMFKLSTSERDDNRFPLMVPVDSEVPFFSYVATFSTHGPFEGRRVKERVTKTYYEHYKMLEKEFDEYFETHDNPVNYLGYPLFVDENTPEEKRKIIDDLDKEYNMHAKEYFLGVMDLDQGIGYLLDALEREDRLKDTTIVILSDHYAYYHDFAFSSKGFNRSDNLTNPEAYHIPGVIYDQKLVQKLKGMSDEQKQQYQVSYHKYEATGDIVLASDKFFNNTDMVPTLLNLLGIEYDSAVYIGEDLFNEKTSLISSRKGGIYNNQFYTNNGVDILNLDEKYKLYQAGKESDFSPEEIQQFQVYEGEMNRFLSLSIDFIIKSNYLNMMYECNYFGSRLLRV